ncbi:RpiB/LacA/LacB family sugar-phosphate isomerase [Nanoarchaeota archaeon]
MKPIIILGADHGGFRLKQAIKKYFFNKEYSVEDVSLYKDPEDDYPDAAQRVAELVKKTRNSVGVLVCTTGSGMTIAANKVKGIRAALAYDTSSAKMAKEHNNANIVCLKGKQQPKNAIKFVTAFAKAEFSKEPRHKRRIKKITKIENA